ncbi:MAG TPA: antibiotic biosynthesis monooxygenase [Streptosporangiaceae bacterium]
MTGSLIVVALGAVAAAAGTGVLAARCARTPRLFLIAWTVAVFALAVALAAQALGYLSGFSDLTFRATELGAQAVAPLTLCLGLVELTGRSIVSRFAMRLAVAAVGVIVVVILGSDPLSPNVTLSKTWPDPHAVYQLVPAALIEFVACFTLFFALLAVLVALGRARRRPEYAPVVSPVLIGAGAAIVVALPGVAMLAGVSLGSAGAALAQVAAVGLTWFAVVAAGRAGVIDQPVPAARESGPRTGYPAAGDDWPEPPADDWPEPTGDESASYGLDDYDGPAGLGYHDDLLDAGYGGEGTGSGGYDPQDTGVGNPALAALAAEPARPASAPPGGYDGRGPDPEIYTGAIDAVGGGLGDGKAWPNGHDSLPEGPLFGQITIYTVLDERVGDFDRMTERVVEQVRANEPGTLVYIAHAVPTAPMQRILYEVYQDRRSYDEHLLQPYVARFESERRAMVLATNSIELGLQQAKVSPLPSFSAISDILSESGIDLTGVTAAGRKGAPGTGSPASYSGPAQAEPEYEHWSPRDDGRYP